tara:strand:+ start:2835 stop:3107 length:273 start_codon:yes stop_codon:yes gene_type:complete
MTVTFTTDPRPTVVGNLIMYTGTFTDDAAATPTGDLDLSALLAEIKLANVLASHPAATGLIDFTIDGTTVKFLAVEVGEGGTWAVMGPRS